MIIPDIFEFDDYFEFLKEIYQINKDKNHSFSYESLARKLKVPKTLIYDVIIYRKKISLKKLYLFIENLDLSELEIEYFISLYLMESENNRIKEVFRNRHKKRFIKKDDISSVKNIKSDDPFMILVLSILRVSEYLPTTKEMQKMIKVIHDIKESQIQCYYEFLLDKKILKVTEDNKVEVEKGTYFVFGENIKNLNSFFSKFDQNAQNFLTLLTKKSKPEGPYTFDSVYINLSQEEAQELSNELLFLRNRLSKIDATPFDCPKRKTYQVDFRLFPIT